MGVILITAIMSTTPKGLSLLLLPLAKDRFQLSPVCGDHLFLLGRSLDHNRNLVVIAVDQCFASFELGDRPDFRVGELQHIFDVLGFILLQVQDDLVLGVVDDGPSVLAVVQAEEVAEVLGGCSSI